MSLLPNLPPPLPLKTVEMPLDLALAWLQIWADEAKVGDETRLPNVLIANLRRSRQLADRIARHSGRRIWATEFATLRCTDYSETAEVPDGEKKRKRSNKSARITTMWSEEYQSWCYWDQKTQDYLPTVYLNQKPAQ